MLSFDKTPVTKELEIEQEEIISSGDIKNSIESFVQTCIKKIGSDAIETLGLQGGRLVPFNDSLITYYATVGYAYDNGRNRFPKISELETQTSLYVDIGLNECINNFESFPNEILVGQVRTETRITNQTVLIHTEYPIKIAVGDSITELRDFRTEIPVRIKYLHSKVNDLIEKHQEDPGWIPITFMNTLDLDINIYPHNKSIMIIEFIDKESIIENKPFRLIFANRFE